MRSLPEQFRRAIAEESEHGMMVAADALQESDDSGNQRLGELLRLYCDIQTYVRTSQSIPQNMGFRFEELNKSFSGQLRRYVSDSGYGRYEKPLGPYYTALIIPQNELMANIDLLSQEPVR